MIDNVVFFFCFCFCYNFSIPSGNLSKTFHPRSNFLNSLSFANDLPALVLDNRKRIRARRFTMLYIEPGRNSIFVLERSKIIRPNICKKKKFGRPPGRGKTQDCIMQQQDGKLRAVWCSRHGSWKSASH